VTGLLGNFLLYLLFSRRVKKIVLLQLGKTSSHGLITHVTHALQECAECNTLLKLRYENMIANEKERTSGRGNALKVWD